MRLIGIVGRAYYNKDNQEIIQTHDAVRRYLNLKDDVVCITLLPTNQECLTNLEPGEDYVDPKLDYILDKCDGFIIPGGTYLYHFDEYVINYAIENDKPLLAICLGFQMLCSMFAKDRNKFEMETRHSDDSHHGRGDEYKHEIVIEEGTKLRSIIGEEKIRVNSVHNDIVDFEMNTLKITAKAPDGVIEAVEHPTKRFIVGLQWHPEYLVDEYSLKILDSFLR
jgi:gamma-glutamyl-gamma-aminobutyrate hydrolase PuuD